MPRIMRGRGSRHTGTSAPVDARRLDQPRIADGDAVGAGEQPQRRRRVGRAATDPSRDRQPLGQDKAPELEALDALGERARGLQHQIVADRSGRRRGRPVDGERERAPRRKGQRVADAGEHHETLDVMVAVGAAADDAERQVDLGGRPFGARGRPRCSAAAGLGGGVGGGGRRGGSSARPDFSFSRIFSRSSGSGLRSRACAHWKPRFETAADPPISVAEMIVDGRVFRLQLDRLLEILHGVFEVAHPVSRPSRANRRCSRRRRAARRRGGSCACPLRDGGPDPPMNSRDN